MHTLLYQCLYLQQEVEDETQKWVIILFIVFFILFVSVLLLILLLIRFRWRLETCGEPCNKLDDIFNCWFTLVDNHGILQVVDKLLMEQGLVLKLMEEKEDVISNM